ncbi:hypothetical protein GCM10028805_46840 [Spirosoma harenae]
MALNVINLSIDVCDTAMTAVKTIGIQTGLSINKIESIGEFLLEECFNIHKAIPEQNNPEEESELTELEQDYDFTPLFAFAPLSSPVQYLLSGNVPFRSEFVSAHVPEIHAPPPQVV